MNIGDYYQQGDVLLKKVLNIPSGCKKEKTKNGNWIIAEGEHTGNFHGIAEKEAIVYERDGKRFILTENGFTITHQEHKHITIEPGIYEIDIVREYDPFEETIRRVKD